MIEYEVVILSADPYEAAEVLNGLAARDWTVVGTVHGDRVILSREIPALSATGHTVLVFGQSSGQSQPTPDSTACDHPLGYRTSLFHEITSGGLQIVESCSRCGTQIVKAGCDVRITSAQPSER